MASDLEGGHVVADGFELGNAFVRMLSASVACSVLAFLLFVFSVSVKLTSADTKPCLW